MLTDRGDFALNDTVSGMVLWESFDYPGDSLLPGVMIGSDQVLTSWESIDDPTCGKFVVRLSKEQPPQVFTWKDSKPYWRGGPWDGWKFIGIPERHPWYSNLISLISGNPRGGAYLTLNSYNPSQVLRLIVTPEGVLQRNVWDEGNKKWDITWQAPGNPCDVYGVCGPFAICIHNKAPICNCLKGFVPQSNEEWSKGNWTRGCVRLKELICEKNGSNLASEKTKFDKFFLLKGIKLPDHHNYLPNLETSDCQQWCLGNCSCKAYAYVEGIYCMAWTKDLMDIEQFSFGGENLFLRLAYAEAEVSQLFISLTTLAGAFLLGGFMICLYRWRTNKRGKKSKVDHFKSDNEIVSRDALKGDDLTQESLELPVYEFKEIIAATDNFSYRNKLGEGGFGPVYKGILDHGQQIAVKRLSSRSGQGIEEFKNEIALISKLQHRNLVKLLGFCIEGEEKLLIYEYMTNKSLDTFLFDPKKRLQVDWATRFNIIQGIGRGLIYLHRDSCLRIIHRDLKSSNILLDDNMNPKISDFGLARTFQMTQEMANTRRIVGTYGYMSPEYAMGGVISEKTDVFSYGVMLLEIVSGRRNTDFVHHEHIYPLEFAWKLWNEGRGTELIDQSLAEPCNPSQRLRCIHVGLLCVQDFANDRPTMTEAVFMLSSEINFPKPKQPLFTVQRLSGISIAQENRNLSSVNEMTNSMTEGR